MQTFVHQKSGFWSGKGSLFKKNKSRELEDRFGVNRTRKGGRGGPISLSVRIPPRFLCEMGLVAPYFPNREGILLFSREEFRPLFTGESERGYYYLQFPPSHISTLPHHHTFVLQAPKKKNKEINRNKRHTFLLFCCVFLGSLYFFFSGGIETASEY